MDPRFTLPESLELIARAEAVARQRYEDWTEFDTGPESWQGLQYGDRNYRIATTMSELRDLTRPASYDAAVRWLVELLAPGQPADGWQMVSGLTGWRLIRWTAGQAGRILVTASPTEDPREALVLALTAALEARR